MVHHTPPTAVRPACGKEGVPLTGTTVQRSRYNQSLASDRYQAAQIEQNTQAGRVLVPDGGGANMTLWLQIKLKGYQDAPWGRGRTSRPRLVALRSVPFTRIPGLLARGRANEVLVDSCPRLLLDTCGGTGWTGL